MLTHFFRNILSKSTKQIRRGTVLCVWTSFGSERLCAEVDVSRVSVKIVLFQSTEIFSTKDFLVFMNTCLCLDKTALACLVLLRPGNQLKAKGKKLEEILEQIIFIIMKVIKELIKVLKLIKILMQKTPTKVNISNDKAPTRNLMQMKYFEKSRKTKFLLIRKSNIRLKNE